MNVVDYNDSESDSSVYGYSDVDIHIDRETAMAIVIVRVIARCSKRWNQWRGGVRW